MMCTIAYIQECFAVHKALQKLHLHSNCSQYWWFLEAVKHHNCKFPQACQVNISNCFTLCLLARLRRFMITVNFAFAIQRYRGLQRSCTSKKESATRMREFHGFLWAFLWASSALANCVAGRSSSLKQWANLGVDKSTVNRIRKNVAMEFTRMRVALWFLSVQECCKPL